MSVVCHTVMNMPLKHQSAPVQAHALTPHPGRPILGLTWAWRRQCCGSSFVAQRSLGRFQCMNDRTSS